MDRDPRRSRGAYRDENPEPLFRLRRRCRSLRGLRHRAAEGDYSYWVEVFEHPQGQREVPFTLQVLEGQRVVHTETGTISLMVHTRRSERR
jgi:hypothetical protein